MTTEKFQHTINSLDRGAQNRLSKHVKMSRNYINLWYMGVKPIPEKHAADIERFFDKEITRSIVNRHDRIQHLKREIRDIRDEIKQFEELRS
jgi:DNA-binding transcriptional regulator YdaS (Cro superfamily)